MKRASWVPYAAVAALLVVLLGLVLLLRRPSPPPVPEVAAAPPAASVPVPPAPPASEAGVRHPIEPVEAAASGASPAQALNPEALLVELFGRKSALGLFQLDNFAQRLVATVDNLGRGQAPARLWPMNPVEGRFTTQSSGDAEVISPDNGLRYTPYVLLIETVDLQQVARAYARLYPALQQAYEDLGYPKAYFNDRVVEVLDQLLATPVIEDPVRVRMPTRNSPAQPPRPWVLYEFDDPALQSLSAGQRMLLRMGPVNERRLKSRLAELRALLATGAPQR